MDRTKVPLKLLCVVLLLSVIITGFRFFSAKAQALADEIIVENANVVWTNTLECSADLINVAKDAPSRIVAEYADSIFSISLNEHKELNPISSAPNLRIVVEYANSIINLDLAPPFPLVQPAPENDVPGEVTTPPIQTQGQPIVDLYGVKTQVMVGEEVIIYLSVVNPITSLGTVMVQITLEIPDGWSAASSEFSPVVGGLQSAVFEIKQGTNPQTIAVHILANQPFEGFVTGYIHYFFDGEEIEYFNQVRIPMTARFEPMSEETDSEERYVPQDSNPSQDPLLESIESILSLIATNWLGFLVLILGVVVIVLVARRG
jgi:hypothetical protein